jgi:hypothetical protein
MITDIIEDGFNDVGQDTQSISCAERGRRLDEPPSAHPSRLQMRANTKGEQRRKEVAQ